MKQPSQKIPENKQKIMKSSVGKSLKPRIPLLAVSNHWKKFNRGRFNSGGISDRLSFMFFEPLIEINIEIFVLDKK